MVKKIYNALCGLLKIICAYWVGKECVWEALKEVTPYLFEGVDMQIFGYFFGTVLAAAGYVGLLLGGIAQLVSLLRDDGRIAFVPMGVLLLAFGHMPVIVFGPYFEPYVVALHWVAVGLTAMDIIVIFADAYRNRIRIFSGANRWKLLSGVMISLLPALLFCLSFTMSEMIINNIKTIEFNKALVGGFDSFTMSDMDGNVYTEEMFRGHKLTMLNVWGTYCGTCIREMPDIQEISEEYDPAVLQIIGMPGNVFRLGQLDEELMAQAVDIIESTGTRYPTLIPSPEINAGVLDYFIGFPTTLFFDENGVQVDMVLGGYDKEGWTEKIEELLANEK